MHVIDGQAGLIICASLIFYSLTIDNILNIIVLLILAGISISMLAGDNSILQKSTETKAKSDEAQIKERIQLAYHSALTGGQGSYTKHTLMNELENEFGTDYDVDDSDDENWKMIAHGQEVIIPAGKAETSEYGIQQDGTFKTKPGLNPTDGKTYDDYNSRLIETEYDQQVVGNLADIGETVYYFFEFPLVYYYHESGDFLGVFSVD